MGWQIALRPHEDTGAPHRLGQHVSIRRGTCVQDDEEQIALAHCEPTTADAFCLDRVAWGVETGRVEETNEDARARDGALHDIAGGAGERRHDRAIVSEQRVQEGRLARVRWSDERDGDSVVDHASVTSGRGPAVDVALKACDRRARSIAIVADALLGKIQLDLEPGDDLDERISHGSNTLGETARERARRESDGAIGPRADHQRDGLRLSEIDTAVEERAPRELAGRSQARAAGDDPPSHYAKQRRRAVTR